MSADDNLRDLRDALSNAFIEADDSMMDIRFDVLDELALIAIKVIKDWTAGEAITFSSTGMGLTDIDEHYRRKAILRFIAEQNEQN